MAPLFAVGFRMLGEIARFEHDAHGQSGYALRLLHSRQQLAALRESKFAELQQLSARPLHGGDDPENRPMPQLQPRPEALAGVAAEEIITLVSGLPRSGTSLMMQLLEAAGLPAFTDGRRAAEASNEKGYYEHDQVGGLLTSPDKSWLADARGHSLKVVAPLLAALPQKISNLKSEISNLHYRVLFLEREMEEILDSQDSMLARLGKPTQPGADIAKAYRQQVRHAKTWLTGRGIPAMSVSYADLVHRPEEALPPLAAFLGVPDRLDAMRAVIDPSLHRACGAAAAVTPFSPSAMRAGGVPDVVGLFFPASSLFGGATVNGAIAYFAPPFFQQVVVGAVGVTGVSGGGPTSVRGVIPISFSDTAINGGVASSGWLDVTALSSFGVDASVQIHRLIFDDASPLAPLGVASTDPAFAEWDPSGVSVIPEPGYNLGLLALGAGGLLIRRRLKRAA